MNRAGFIKFDEDTIIYPRESTQFGEVGSDGNIVPFKETEIWKNDSIGLQKLDKENKLYFESMPGKNHISYTNVWFYEHMIPILYEKNWMPAQQEN